MIPESPLITSAVNANTDELFVKAALMNSPEVPYRKGVVQGYISLILGELLPKVKLLSANQVSETVEQKLIEYCSLHYKEAISLTTVADALGYSSTHLSHIFTDKFKIGFSKFISTMRVEDAKRMLRGDKGITQIALDCGFGSIRNFNRVFKEYTGQTPSEYKNK